jgi:hypothetical protein
MKKCKIQDVYKKSHCDFFYIGLCTAEKLNKKCPFEEDINKIKDHKIL